MFKLMGKKIIILQFYPKNFCLYRHLVKRAYQKLTFLISQPKHMFLAPKTYNCGYSKEPYP